MMFCTGTTEKGKHKPRMMKYFHTSDGCVHFACPEPGCGKVSTVCRTPPPPWVRRRGYTPKPKKQQKRSSWINRIMGPR